MTIKTTNLAFAGEYFIDTVFLSTAEGVELNVLKQVSAIVVYEDLFSPFISGILYLKDTFDLPNFMGRGGINRLALKIFTPTIEDSKKINLVFHVFKHSDRVLTGDRTQQYALHFISEESLNNQKKISSVFSGNPSTLVNTIVRKHLNSRKSVISSIATNDIKYISNFWTPAQNLSYISDHARGKDGDNFVFFENREGFNFSCLTENSSKQVATIQEFSNIDYIGKSNNPATPQTITRDINLDYKSILSINVDVVYDYMRDYDAGMIKSKLYISDPVLKKYKVQNFDMRGDTKSPLNKNRVYTDSVVENSYPVILNGIRQYNNMSAGDSTNLDFVQTRMSQLRQFHSSKLEIEVFGRTDYTVGKKIYLNMNQIKSFSQDDKAEEFLDKITGGSYLISAVAHKFNGDKHTCTLELIKDSTQLQ